MSLDKHVTSLSAKCFFQLRQLRHIRRSLDDSIATLVHAFVASRVDYCVGLLAGAPQRRRQLDKLQRVLNAAARVVSNSGKYDRGLNKFRRHTLHWLDVADRIRFRLCVQVYKCQHSMTPGYLAELSVAAPKGVRGPRPLTDYWPPLAPYPICALSNAPRIVAPFFSLLT